MSEQSPDDTVGEEHDSGERPEEMAGQEHDSGKSQDSGATYDPDQDPDADPKMLTTKHPAERGENERDPAEGPDDESATDA